MTNQIEKDIKELNDKYRNNEIWDIKEKLYGKDNIVIPMYDKAFKTYFYGYEIVIAKLVCKLLNVDYICHIVLNNELKNTTLYSKGKRVDMILKINNYIIADIEINNSNISYSREKNLRYLFDLYNEIISSGDDYKKYKQLEALQLNISKYMPDSGIINEYAILELNKYNYYVKNIKIIDINMDKLMKELYNNNEVKDEIRLLGIFCATSINEMSYMLGDDIFMEEKEKTDFLDKVFCANNLKALFARRDKIDEFYERLEKAEELERAESKGMDIGINKGMDIGKDQAKEEMIINMLKDNVDDKIISKYSDVSIADILKIKEKLTI